jgi:Ras-related protein Rab-35
MKFAFYRLRLFIYSYYRNAAGILIAYDVTNGESFVNTKRWIEEVKNNCGDDGVPIVLVGNKCDAPNRVVSLNDQQEYAKLMNLPFFETSAKENINVDEVFNELTRLILARQARINQMNQNSASSGVGAAKSTYANGASDTVNLRQNRGGENRQKKKCC